jgi:putative sigma-54 modulation protein
VLTAEKFRRMADVTLNVNGTVIKAEEETEDMYAAIDQVMDKIESQVKKYRDKIRNRRVKSEGTLGAGQGDEAGETAADEPDIILEKMVAKPMDAEEAAMQLTISQQDFLVFRNPRSGDINVIYKRKDRNLGLIEPAM